MNNGTVSTSNTHWQLKSEWRHSATRQVTRRDRTHTRLPSPDSDSRRLAGPRDRPKVMPLSVVVQPSKHLSAPRGTAANTIGELPPGRLIFRTGSPDQRAYSYMSELVAPSGSGCQSRRDLVSLAGWRWMMAHWQAGETRRSAAGGSRLVADCPPGRQPATGTGISRLRDRLGGHTGGVLPPAPAEEGSCQHRQNSFPLEPGSRGYLTDFGSFSS